MRHDYDDDDDEISDDGDAFSNTLYDVGTSQIYNLLQVRAQHCPALADRDFFALIEVMLEPLKEFLSPEQFDELWDMVYLFLFELRRQSDPMVTYEECEQQVRQHLLGPRRVTPGPKRPGRPRKKGHR